MRILIADDNEINRKRLRKALASKGHEAEEVSDGVEALEKLRSGKFDAVISDVLMPRMDGYRLSYEVRRSEELRDTQIIIYSSTYTSLADKRLALKVGIDRFIPYSVSPTVILRALENAARTPRKRADVAAPVTELESLKEYSAILVRRLKEANLKLGTWNKRLARANEALRAAEQRSRVLMEKAKDVILVLDSRGVILEANQAAEELYGRPRAEIVGRHFMETLAPEERDAGGERFQTVLSHGHVRARGIHVHADGRGIQIEVSASRIEIGGDHLVLAIVRDVSERKSFEDQLQRSYQELRLLRARMETAREEEASRIARELHDELGQALTGFKMDLTWLGQKLPDARTAAGALGGKVAEMARSIDATIESVRRIATELRPPVLDDLGLEPALVWLVQEFQARSGILARFETRGEEIGLDPDRATAAFRIVQEALTNVARHARASRVWVEVRKETDGVTVCVADDGIGIAAEAAAGRVSLGLLGMRERAQSFEGHLAVGPREAGGTSVTLWLPFRAHAAVASGPARGLDSS